MSSKQRHNSGSSENGSTLIELLVAMALLLGVLLPAGALLTYVSHSPLNKQKIVALGMAQPAMEEILRQDEWNPKVEVTERLAGWSLKTEIKKLDQIVEIEVTAIRRGKTIIQLNTYRQAHKIKADESN